MPNRPASHRRRRLTALVVLPLVAGACGADCVAPPCAQPLALTVTVTSNAAADPVPGAFVQPAGYSTGIQCTEAPGSTCDILGEAGTYELDIGAPGFQTVHRTVTVLPAERASCGCSTVDTQHIYVTLMPAE